MTNLKFAEGPSLDRTHFYIFISGHLLTHNIFSRLSLKGSSHGEYCIDIVLRLEFINIGIVVYKQMVIDILC